MSKITNKLTKSDLFSWGILGILFIYMFSLNYLMPLLRDDYWYALVWDTSNKIVAWPDVFQSLYTHYLTHGGRMTAFFVLDSFLLLGKPWFNLLNAFLFVALTVLIYWHSQRKITLRFNPYILLLIILFTWLGLPHFAEVTVWMTGACVYLLTTVIILTFLLPYHFSLLGKPLWEDSLGAAIGMFWCGVVAGWTVENTAGTMTFLITVTTFYFSRKNNLSKWMVSGSCGALLGLILLVIAPGNFVRWSSQPVGLIYHFTNQIVAGAEMLFYVLPIVLFMLLGWRILLKNYACSKSTSMPVQGDSGNQFSISSLLIIGIIVFLLLSYANDFFFSKWLGNLIYNHLTAWLGITDSNLKFKFLATMSGLEEMVTYLLTITQLYRYISKKLVLQKKDVQTTESLITSWDIMAAYPAYYFVVVWSALALVNNLVMIASPQFPGRALFGSAVFLIIGAVSSLTIPDIYEYFLTNTRKKYLLLICGLIMVPMATAVLYQHIYVYQAQSQRVSYINKMVSQGATILEIEPISLKNRVLRHVYFDDLNDHLFIKPYICNYYGLKDIKVKN